jgi:carbonic anhydrase/acetyltransferase-like protein (isoleucine patch superfamily)
LSLALTRTVTKPRVDPSCYVAPEAIIVGDVVIGRGCSIWPYAVIRADLSEVRIGDDSNIQEHCQIHGNPGRPTVIGGKVTVGHGAIIHAARIGDCVIVGMNASILDEATIGSGSIIGANALVTSGMNVPEASLVVGVPAKVVRQGDPTLRETAKKNAEEYAALRDAHKRGEFERYRA